MGYFFTFLAGEIFGMFLTTLIVINRINKGEKYDTTDNRNKGN